jgi:hypothetical protein
MTYKEMNKVQLAQEILRVRNLLYGKYNSHTYHQNKKYLNKLENEWRTKYGES